MGCSPLGLREKLPGGYKEIEMQSTLGEGWNILAPNEGPPLPRSLGIFWPWHKGEQASAPVEEYVPREAPAAPTTVAPITVISQPSAPAPAAPTVVPVTVISQAASEAPVTRELAPAVVKYTLYTDTIGEGRTIPSSGRTYESSITVEVTAVPATGWKFDHWEGDAYGTASVARVKMDSDKEVIAVFAQLAAPTVPTTPTVPVTPTAPTVPTGTAPPYPAIGMFGAPSLSLPSQVTLGDTLTGSASIPTMWPSSLPQPPSMPTYPVTAQVLLIGSEYLIASKAAGFTPGQLFTVPINYNTSNLPKEGTYSVKVKLIDAQGTKFVDSIVGSLKVLAAALPEPPPTPGYKLTIDVDPPDASKGYAYAEPALPSYPKGTVIKLTAVARTTSNYLDHWTINGDYKPGGPGNYSITLWPIAQDVKVKAFFK